MRRVVAGVLVVATAIGCASFGGSERTPIVEALSLSVSNQTALVISISVNGQTFAVLPPMTDQDPIVDRLPPVPWDVRATTASGRELASLEVHEGDAWYTPPDSNGHSSQASKAVRVDLSCGRLDIWAVHPMIGPAPPSSFPPNDCVP